MKINKNLAEGRVLKTWNLADRLNSQNKGLDQDFKS